MLASRADSFCTATQPLEGSLRRRPLEAIADTHRDSAPDLRIGTALAFMTEAPQKADNRRLT